MLHIQSKSGEILSSHVGKDFRLCNGIGRSKDGQRREREREGWFRVTDDSGVFPTAKPPAFVGA